MEVELLNRLISMPTYPDSRKPDIQALLNQYKRETNTSTSFFDDRRQCLNVNFNELRETARRELASKINTVSVISDIGFSKGFLDSNANHNDSVQIPSELKLQSSIPRPSVVQYNSVPKYMSRPLPLTDLHKIISALEAALKEQRKLLEANFNALPKHKKDVIIRLRDEARDLKVSLTASFISEVDWKSNLETRLQAKMKWATQILRQLKLVKEMRLKSKIFYVVIV